MAEPRVPMTPRGQERLREELKKLREIDAPQVVRDIAVARDHGDISENAEYHAAKDRQGMIAARVKYLEDVLSRAEVIDPSKLKGERVQFGARVRLINVETEEECCYEILGPEESDVKRGQISVSSPLARALLGHVPGEEVTVRLPSGTRIYEIQSITFG
jgi:transcription elongation factor GreA